MSLPNFTFRLASESDIENIVRLVNRAYRGQSGQIGWTTESDLLGGQRTDTLQIQELLRTDAGSLIVAEDDGSLLGCVHIELRAQARSYLGMLTVEPTSQGTGLGKALVREAEQRARESFESKTMEMTVIAQREDLIRWYERLGYRRTEETRAFPYGDERFGQPLRDDLYFIVLEKNLIPF